MPRGTGQRRTVVAGNMGGRSRQGGPGRSGPVARLPVTVRYDSDAPHTEFYLITRNLPTGVHETETY